MVYNKIKRIHFEKRLIIQFNKAWCTRGYFNFRRCGEEQILIEYDSVIDKSKNILHFKIWSKDEIYRLMLYILRLDNSRKDN